MFSILPKRTRTRGIVLVIAVVAGGCGQPSADSESPGLTETAQDDGAAQPAGHNHGGWWCGVHGIPEEVCSMCSTKAAADFKAKGDWCEDHNRAESQCFECDPARAEKFAKLYEAKFGHAPPPRSP